MNPCKHRLGISGAWPCALDEGHDGAHVSSNGSCALSSYVEPSNYNAHYIHTANVKYGAVPVYLLREAQKERDQLKADLDMVDSDLQLAVKRLTAENERLTRERDEARAEVERLRKAKHTNGCRQQSAYNAECVCGADEAQRDLLRTVAERQREACAGAAFTAISLHPEPSPRSQFREAVVNAVEATPLVTEGEL